MMGWPCLSIQFGTRFTFTIFALKIGKSLILCAGAHCNLFSKVHIFWEGHKILQNLHLIFDWHYIGQKEGGDFAKFCGLLKMYELYFFLVLNFISWAFDIHILSIFQWTDPDIVKYTNIIKRILNGYDLSKL